MTSSETRVAARRAGWALLLALGAAGAVRAHEEARVQRDIEYAQVEGKPLQLDLYLPPGTKSPPLIVWVHGGAWRAGSRKDVPLFTDGARHELLREEDEVRDRVLAAIDTFLDRLFPR
jgi:acetyl esterase/lipase